MVCVVSALWRMLHLIRGYARSIAMKRLTFIVLMLTGTMAWAGAPAKVLLLPFDSVGPVEKDWVAKALQQNLVAELARVNSVAAVTGDRAVSGAEAALK